MSSHNETAEAPSETPGVPVHEEIVDTPAVEELVADPKPEVAVEKDAKASEVTPAVGSESTPKPAVLTVHHLEDSRSQRLLWLLEELDVPYEIKKYERNSEMRAPQSLKKVHPLGKSPVITDGDVTLAESGAITEYLVDKYGQKFRPSESGKVDDLYFTHYSEGSVMPVIVNLIIFTKIPQQSPVFIRPLVKSVFKTVEKKLVVPELKGHCELIESHLKKSPTGWLVGDDHPTPADFMMAYTVELLVEMARSVSGPKMKEYVTRVQERPAYKRAVEKGGKIDSK